VEDGEPGQHFAFWPSNIEDAFDCDVPALDLVHVLT
jgi:hypothetical protein